MTYDEIIKATYPTGLKPNPEQEKAIKSTAGPLLIVAGPGSGKTKTLITRTLYLLLVQEVAPENILLCTFTEKAARQLRDRLNSGIKKCGAENVDIHEMAIGTIHSICQRIIDEYPNEAGVGIYSKTRGLGRGYTVLDDLKRMFFLMDHFDEIYGDPDSAGKYLGLWKGFWGTIKRSQEWFDKITEENINLDDLSISPEPVVQNVGQAMRAYRRLMLEQGRIDFSHLQWLALDLLQNNAGARAEFQDRFEYVMVDEYQDTNYIQEQLVFALANADRNIAVVGDVDQSIYRFRGATTQNILEFPERVNEPSLEPINLSINYRSSQQIVDLYQSYRNETNWRGFRYDLDVVADVVMEDNRPEYMALIAIDEDNAELEAKQVADLILRFKKDGVVEDYNQIAILLHSVRNDHSGPYIEAIQALRDQGENIDVYAPRARLYFERPEVMCAMAGLQAMNPVALSDFERGYPGQESESVDQYMGRCIDEFRSRDGDAGHKEFLETIRKLKDELTALKKSKGKAKKVFLEYYYHVINTKFMAKWLDAELPARHLAQLSQLIETFSEYYSIDWINGKNCDYAWEKFFNSFFGVLLEGGLNEYEDEEQAFPSGAVQIMTFHQSKGLEFPVIISGSLHAQITTGKKVDDYLMEYYDRELLEPRSRITEFDKRRLYYVAFSRARDFLVLTGHNDLTDRIAKRKLHFENVLSQCALWQDVQSQGDYKNVTCSRGDEELLKPVFGFTSHISAFERCPMQFKLQKLMGFVPKRNEQLWMGNVVHNTLKDIHDHVLKKKPGTLDHALVKEYLEQNIESMRRSGTPPPKAKAGSKTHEEIALESIQRYVTDNDHKLKHCKWAEKEILVDEKDYTLTGVIDLLIHDDTGHVELVDFKAGRKKNNEKYREGYADQIRLYCKQVEPKIGKVPDEGYLYWITEPAGSNPKDVIDTDPALLSDTRKRVGEIAERIILKDFPKLPRKVDDVCGICEFCERCW